MCVRKEQRAYKALLLAWGLVLAAITFVVMLPVASAVADSIGEKFYSLPSSLNAKTTGRQEQWMTPKSESYVKAGLRAMDSVVDKNTGKTLNQLIDEIGGGDAVYLKAIAIHESGGGISNYEKGENSRGAMCAFQIDPNTLSTVASKFGVKPSEAAVALMTDLAFCVNAGKYVWDLKKSKARGDIALAHCYYNGQTSALKAMGDKCWASMEYAVMESIIRDGKVIIEVDGDKKSITYGQITYKSLDGKILAQSLNCQDHTDKNLPLAFAKMADAYQVYTTNLRNEVYYQGVTSSMSVQSRPFPSTKKLWCIDDIHFKMDIVRGLINPINMLWQQFMNMVTSLANQLCNYVITSIRSAVDNLMNSICISLPDFSFSMSLPSLKRKGCNGVPLGQAMLVNGLGLSETAAGNALNNLQGLPGIDVLSSATWSSPSIAAPLRMIFGTKGSPPP